MNQPTMGRGLTFAMAAASGLAVANIYYNQPMLGIIERDFPGLGAAGIIPAITQIGYAAGLLLLVPLGDVVDRRRMIVLQLLSLALTLSAAALAPTLWSLALASLLIGVGATAAQQIVPFAAALASEEKRGATIGLVMSGLLCGILLSRTLSGFVATHAGWRAMFWLGVPLALGAAATMAIALPRAGLPRAPGLRYGALIASLASLWRGQPLLRRATFTQATLFASFSTFWTTLSLHLEQPPYELGPAAAGSFGIVGAVGMLAAPLAGRLADKRGPQMVITLGVVMVLLGWAAFGFWNAIAGLVLGTILLDFGVQSALIAHQHSVYALIPEARNRINTVFMSGMFAGGALGSVGATTAWRMGGWPAVCGWGAAVTVVGLVLRLGASKKPG